MSTNTEDQTRHWSREGVYLDRDGTVRRHRRYSPPPGVAEMVGHVRDNLDRARITCQWLDEASDTEYAQMSWDATEMIAHKITPSMVFNFGDHETWIYVWEALRAMAGMDAPRAVALLDLASEDLAQRHDVARGEPVRSNGLCPHCWDDDQ